MTMLTMESIHETLHSVLAYLTFFIHARLPSCFSTFESAKLSYEVRRYLHRFWVVRAMVWIWNYWHEVAAETVLLVWPIVLGVSYDLGHPIPSLLI